MAHVSVGTSATKVADVPRGQSDVMVQNLGSDNVYVSRDPAVSTSGTTGGLELKPDDVVSLYARSDVHAIANSGTQTVAVIWL